MSLGQVLQYCNCESAANLCACLRFRSPGRNPPALALTLFWPKISRKLIDFADGVGFTKSAQERGEFFLEQNSKHSRLKNQES
jgi:hypothetical protein